MMSSLIVSCRDNIWHSTKFIAKVGLRDNTIRRFHCPLILGFFWAAPGVHRQENLNTYSRNGWQLQKKNIIPPRNYQRNVFKCIYIFFIFFLSSLLVNYRHNLNRQVNLKIKNLRKEHTFLLLSPHAVKLTFDSHGPLIVTKSSSSVRLSMTSTVQSDTHLYQCTYYTNYLTFNC